ncbi:thioredoxin [Romboutsia sp.]|uniref:thioredoxin n=1 Tax=Romboutsia sp. TaxID=1965302 RepID=UPI003F2BEDF2
MPRVINMDEFNNEVANASGVAVIDFYATWCGPCKMLAPIFQEVEHEFEGKAKFFKVDIDQSLDLARQYNVSSVPTMMIFRDGELVETLVGFMPKENLVSKIKQYL